MSGRLNIGIEQDVRWLEVAVQNPALVRVVHRPRNRHHQRSPSTAWSRLKAVRVLLQAAAADQFHADDGAAVVLGHVKHAHDVVME
jgi:hypothetical protein